MRGNTPKNRLGRALAVLLVALGIPGLAQADGDNKRAAKAQSERAAVLYRLAKFDQARVLYERAYELYPAPELLFNIGQCHRQRGNDERALFFFEGYLREQPRAKNRRLVEQLIARARERQASRAVHAVASQSGGLVNLGDAAQRPARDRRAPALYEKWWFWTAVGGAALVAGGGVYWAMDGGGTPSGSLGTVDWR